MRREGPSGRRKAPFGIAVRATSVTNGPLRRLADERTLDWCGGLPAGSEVGRSLRGRESIVSSKQQQAPVWESDTTGRTTRRLDSTALRKWGLAIALLGFVASFLGQQVQSGATTQSAMLFWGVVNGLGGLALLVGILIGLIGLVIGLNQSRRQ
jgi:hypothetical protein